MKRLITERDLVSGAVSGRIVLDGSTILTPAARDRAVRLGLEIVEAAPGGGWHAVAPTAAAPSAAPCPRCGNTTCSCSGAGLQLATGGCHAASLGALADGLYLVRVQGGQATAVLAATGPGLMQRARGGG